MTRRILSIRPDLELHLSDDPCLLLVRAAEHQHQVARVAVDLIIIIVIIITIIIIINVSSSSPHHLHHAEEDPLQAEPLGGDGDAVLLQRGQEHLVLVSQHPGNPSLTVAWLCIII